MNIAFDIDGVLTNIEKYQLEVAGKFYKEKYDNGATTMKPNSVIDSIVEYYRDYCANSHSGDYIYSEMVSERYEAVRSKIAKFINARESSEIVFTSGATDGINRIVFGYFKDNLKSGDEVLLTNSEILRKLMI